MQEINHLIVFIITLYENNVRMATYFDIGRIIMQNESVYMRPFYKTPVFHVHNTIEYVTH